MIFVMTSCSARSVPWQWPRPRTVSAMVVAWTWGTPAASRSISIGPSPDSVQRVRPRSFMADRLPRSAIPLSARGVSNASRGPRGSRHTPRLKTADPGAKAVGQTNSRPHRCCFTTRSPHAAMRSAHPRSPPCDRPCPDGGVRSRGRHGAGRQAQRRRTHASASEQLLPAAQACSLAGEALRRASGSPRARPWPRGAARRRRATAARPRTRRSARRASRAGRARAPP